MRLELGRPVRCTDGAAGTLGDVVVDAVNNIVTHVVVQPEDDPAAARLAPMQLLEPGADDREISLRCTRDALMKLEPVREFAYLRPGEATEKDPKWDVGTEDVLTVPQAAPSAFGEYGGEFDTAAGIAYDRVPKGEIELRHASAVYSADGRHVGSVEGVVVDGENRITQLLLERGHLWWRRELEIPAESVAKFETDLVTLRLNKKQIGA